ncbi:MAG: hypothetical protein QOF58_4591, partial [Pseudonocardiales bacterium]|nr:hypothetical protein [Pseudonocardiales bacterium]
MNRFAMSLRELVGHSEGTEVG